MVTRGVKHKLFFGVIACLFTGLFLITFISANTLPAHCKTPLMILYSDCKTTTTNPTNTNHCNTPLMIFYLDCKNTTKPASPITPNPKLADFNKGSNCGDVPAVCYTCPDGSCKSSVCNSQGKITGWSSCPGSTKKTTNPSTGTTTPVSFCGSYAKQGDYAIQNGKAVLCSGGCSGGSCS